MATMTITYQRDKRLNVREEPRRDAPVLRTIAPGCSEECVEVREGWAELVGGGYADASFALVTPGGGGLPEPAEPEPAEHEPEPEQEPPAEALMDMTKAQLVEFAQQCGLTVGSKATKAEIVAAILTDA